MYDNIWKKIPQIPNATIAERVSFVKEHSEALVLSVLKLASALNMSPYMSSLLK